LSGINEVLGEAGHRKAPLSGAGDSSGFQSVHRCVTVRLIHEFEAHVLDEVSEPSPDVGRSASLDPHGVEDSLSEVAGRPTSMSNVDQSVSMSDKRPPGRSTRAISATACFGVSQPLQGPFGSSGVEGAVRLGELKSIADPEPDPALAVRARRLGTRDHFRRDVDADYLSIGFRDR